MPSDGTLHFAPAEILTAATLFTLTLTSVMTTLLLRRRNERLQMLESGLKSVAGGMRNVAGQIASVDAMAFWVETL